MQDETFLGPECECPELSYDDRLSAASDKAHTERMNAMWDNDHVLGLLEREYGLEHGTLDDYRID